nr:FCD domain-containing protein [Leucobacter edaphi]
MAVHYEAISAACAEYACRRAAPEELEVVERILASAGTLARDAWRRRVTDVQLELAALSQSVRLTSEHVRVQTEFTPYLALQDADPDRRAVTHETLMRQIAATRAGDPVEARAQVSAGVRGAVRWLTGFRAELLAAAADGDLRGRLNARGSTDAPAPDDGGHGGNDAAGSRAGDPQRR